MNDRRSPSWTTLVSETVRISRVTNSGARAEAAGWSRRSTATRYRATAQQPVNKCESPEGPDNCQSVAAEAHEAEHGGRDQAAEGCEARNDECARMISDRMHPPLMREQDPAQRRKDSRSGSTAPNARLVDMASAHKLVDVRDLINQRSGVKPDRRQAVGGGEHDRIVLGGVEVGDWDLDVDLAQWRDSFGQGGILPRPRLAQCRRWR